MTTLPKIEYPSNMHLACAPLLSPPTLALVIKRTYDIGTDGTCTLAEEQYPICDDAEPYEELESPEVSPPKWDNDLFALKQMTDIVVQGSAQTYGRPASQTIVELKFGNVCRAIRVFGERTCALNRYGALEMSPAAPFDTMPIRYSNAYGGLDVAALEKYGDPVEETYDFIRPEHKLATTSPFHYPRNPTGKGYLIDADLLDAAPIAVPNLEWIEEPITPKRLAVGDVKNWMNGPLPAAFDWYEQAWFPRFAYLGFMAEHTVPATGVPEVVRKLAADDLMAERSIMDGDIHPWFVQGATPGLYAARIQPDEAFSVRNMFAARPEMVVRLPGEIPSVDLDLPMRSSVSATPHINSVVIQSDEAKVIVVWSCRAKVQRPYWEPEFEHIPYHLNWKRG